MDEQLLIALSAYADGELQGPGRESLEASLGNTPELRELLATFQRLDHAVGQSSVPAAEERLGALWERLAEQTITVPKHISRRLDQAAAELLAPDPGHGLFDQMWAHIAGRRPAAQVEAHAPLVGQERWGSVWDGVVSKTDHKMRSLKARSQPRRFFIWATRGRRLALAASVAAALLLGGVALWLRPQDDNEVVAFVVPEALDDAYLVHVKYVNGQAAPVICFYLKPEQSRERNWSWVPD